MYQLMKPASPEHAKSYAACYRKRISEPSLLLPADESSTFLYSAGTYVGTKPHRPASQTNVISGFLNALSAMRCQQWAVSTHYRTQLFVTLYPMFAKTLIRLKTCQRRNGERHDGSRGIFSSHCWKTP
jgi:hypothetical protein